MNFIQLYWKFNYMFETMSNIDKVYAKERMIVLEYMCR